MSGAIQLSEERGVRYLHFGSRWIQGAMRLARPHALELEYTRQMMLPLALRGEAWPRRVLVVGLGAGSLVRFLWRFRPRARIVAVEVREDVVRAAQQYFRLPDDARVEVEVDDGARYVEGDCGAFDLILVDGYDARGRVGALDTPRFYANCRRRMAEGGVLATNLLSRHRGVDASLARLRDAFGGEAAALPPAQSGNVVLLAGHGAPLELDDPALATRAQALRDATGLDLAATLARLGVVAREGAGARNARRRR
ncbi:MAG: spermidine synthase [Betaproteobacteria bacterium]|nr:spermidine synthase [Betaproteobacteria bacterium]MDH5287906.1 spermidine synthase [Betaproteobacteria bacterium]